jgi:hypothetical protein
MMRKMLGLHHWTAALLKIQHAPQHSDKERIFEAAHAGIFGSSPCPLVS